MHMHIAVRQKRLVPPARDPELERVALDRAQPNLRALTDHLA